jgi:hypothetical protein
VVLEQDLFAEDLAVGLLEVMGLVTEALGQAADFEEMVAGLMEEALDEAAFP